MAMYPNGRYLTLLRGRFLTGPNTQLDVSTKMAGDRLNRFISESWSQKVGDMPSGYGFGGGAIVPALKTGGLSSFNGKAITFTQSGALINGMTLIGPATFSMTGTGGLGLIITLSASGTFTFSQTGSVNLTIGLAGSGTWSITQAGSLNLIIPVAGSSSFTVSTSANLKGYAGLSGDITPFTELSPQSLAAAVWDAVLSEHQDVGSTGKALNDAGAAGNPWSADASTNNDPGTMGEKLNDAAAGGGSSSSGLTLGQFLALK